MLLATEAKRARQRRRRRDRDGEREREGGREGERARAVQRFLTFPRPPPVRRLWPRGGIGIGAGNPPNHTPGKIKTREEEEDRGNYWQCERRNLFYILAPPPFVLSRPPKKIGRDVARIPNSQFEFSTIFPLLSSPLLPSLRSDERKIVLIKGGGGRERIRSGSLIFVRNYSQKNINVGRMVSSNGVHLCEKRILYEFPLPAFSPA